MLILSDEQTADRIPDNSSKDCTNDLNNQEENQDLSFSDQGLDCKQEPIYVGQNTEENGIHGWNTGDLINKQDGYSLLKKLYSNDNQLNLVKNQNAFLVNSNSKQTNCKRKIFGETIENITTKHNQVDQEQIYSFRNKPVLHQENKQITLEKNEKKLICNHLYTFKAGAIDFQEPQKSTLTSSNKKMNSNKLQCPSGFMSPTFKNTTGKYLSTKTITKHERKKANTQFIEKKNNKDLMSLFKIAINEDDSENLKFIKNAHNNDKLIESKSLTSRNSIANSMNPSDSVKFYDNINNNKFTTFSRGMVLNENFGKNESSRDVFNKLKKINCLINNDFDDNFYMKDAKEIHNKQDFFKTTQNKFYDMNNKGELIPRDTQTPNTIKRKKFQKDGLLKSEVLRTDDACGYQTSNTECNNPKPIHFNYGDVNDIKKNHSLDFKSTISAYFYQKERNSLRTGPKNKNIDTKRNKTSAETDHIQYKEIFHDKLKSKLKIDINPNLVPMDFKTERRISGMHKTTKSEIPFTDTNFYMKNCKSPYKVDYQENQPQKEELKLSHGKKSCKDLQYSNIQNMQTARNITCTSPILKSNIDKNKKFLINKNLLISHQKIDSNVTSLKHACRGKYSLRNVDKSPKPLRYLEERIKMNSISKKLIDIT